MTSFSVSAEFSTSSHEIYEAWLNGDSHSAMTGGEATGSPVAESEFTAWDGYIWGRNLELFQDTRIVQSWRTTDFQEDDPDSLVEIELETTERGCKVTIHHSNIPEDHPSDYEQGWKEHYFEPMADYFGNQ